MKKSLLAVASAITILASGSVNAQTILNGPYYATPSWDQQLPAAQRFIVLSNWNNEAVLDRETGLIWQRTPGFPTIPLLTDPWLNVAFVCHHLGSGVFATKMNRIGWRLPSVEELASLVDQTQTNPALPLGHPFLGVQNGAYWAATTVEGSAQDAYFVDFSTGTVDVDTKSHVRFYWCVRGGPSVSNPIQ
jgi:hypothetical protein